MQMEDEKIEAVRNWPEPKSVRDIQVFLGFANFYWCFIKGFNKIAGPLKLMLEIIRLAGNLSLSVAENAEIDSIGGGDCNNKMVERLPLISKNLNGATGYLTPNTKWAFTQLRQTFTKATILQHFDPECHIRIEIDASGYAISEILSQLTLDHLGQ